MSRLGRVILVAALASLCPGALCAEITPAEPVAAPGATPPSVRLVSSGAGGFILEFDLPRMETKQVSLEGQLYQSIEVPGGAAIGDPGEPELPVFGRLIALPDGFTAKVVSTVLDEEDLTGYRIAPAQRDGEPRTGAKREVSGWKGFGSLPAVEIGAPAVFRDLRVAPVVFRPVKYNPSQGVLRVARKIRAEVRYVREETTAAGAPGAGPIGRGAKDAAGTDQFWRSGRSRPIAPSFDALYRRLVVNYPFERSGEMSDGRAVQPGSWVLICSPDFNVTSRLAPLVEWRRRQGYPVRMATTLETGTTAESIRAWLRNAYQSWEDPPEYVVLAGDATVSYASRPGSRRSPANTAKETTRTPSSTGTISCRTCTSAGSPSTP